MAGSPAQTWFNDLVVVPFLRVGVIQWLISNDDAIMYRSDPMVACDGPKLLGKATTAAEADCCGIASTGAQATSGSARGDKFRAYWRGNGMYWSVGAKYGER